MHNPRTCSNIKKSNVWVPPSPRRLTFILTPKLERFSLKSRRKLDFFSNFVYHIEDKRQGAPLTLAFVNFITGLGPALETNPLHCQLFNKTTLIGKVNLTNLYPLNQKIIQSDSRKIKNLQNHQWQINSLITRIPLIFTSTNKL